MALKQGELELEELEEIRLDNENSKELDDFFNN